MKLMRRIFHKVHLSSIKVIMVKRVHNLLTSFYPVVHILRRVEHMSTQKAEYKSQDKQFKLDCAYCRQTNNRISTECSAKPSFVERHLPALVGEMIGPLPLPLAWMASNGGSSDWSIHKLDDQFTMSKHCTYPLHPTSIDNLFSISNQEPWHKSRSRI